MANKTKTPDTAIIIENDSWRIKVYLGLGGLVVLTILAFLYRVEAGIIALAIGGAWAARIAFVGYHQHKLAGFDRRRLEAETAKAEAEAVAAKAQSFFVETNSGVFVLDGIAVNAFYPAVSASKLLADIPQLALPAPEPQRRRLLDVEYIHLLIVGPSGSGKTTALCHLIDAAPGNTLIFALDPHAQFGEWPGRVSEIIGNGRDYGAIDARLLGLMEVMNRRYNGAEATTQKILIVADEWLSILDRCPHAKDFFNTIGSEARKVNMSLVISSISATVDDLAVSAAIRDNLAQLTLSRAWRRDNLGELKWSRADKEMIELPGRYIPRAALLPSTPAPAIVEDDFTPLDFDSGPVAPAPDPTELKIFELHQAGKSLNAIFKELYPGRSYGGVQAAELKAILAKFGVSL
jgi:hypothetical protein